MWTQRNTDWTQYEVKEKHATYLEGINIFDMNPFKVRHPELSPEKLVLASSLKNFKKTDGDTEKDEEFIAVSAISGKPYLREDRLDKVFRLFLFESSTIHIYKQTINEYTVLKRERKRASKIEY